MTARTRAGGFAYVAFGILVAASAVVHLTADDPTLAAWPGLIGAIFGILGLAAVYGLTGDRFGRWGQLACVAAMTGLALSVGQLYGLTFEPPGSGPLGPLFPLGYGPFLFGFVLLGVLLLASDGVPRPAAAALITGAVLNAAGFTTPEVRLVGVVIFGTGIAWLGALALRRSRLVATPPTTPSEPAEGAVPAPRQAGTGVPA